LKRCLADRGIDVTTRPPPTDEPTRLEISHLRRETRTALELALIDFAPPQIIDKLACVTGVLEALAELPGDSPPVMAMAPITADRARIALDGWRAWADKHKKTA
jgi:hypothetical protein